MLGQALVIVCSLVLVPIVLDAVGVVDYGIWILADTVLTFVFLVDAGMSTALVKYVSESHARREYEEGARLVATALWLYALIGVTVAVAGCALALALSTLASLDGHTRAVVPGVIAFVALGAGISIPGIAPLAVLQGLQRFGTINLLAGAGALLSVGATVVAIGLGMGIVGVAGANAVCSAVTFTATLTTARRVAPEFMSGGLRADWYRARRLAAFSVPVAVVQVADRLQMRTDTLVIGAALPVRFVTVYNLGQRLADGTRLFAVQFSRVLLPIATTSGGAVRDIRALQPLFLTATRISVALGLAAALPLAILGNSVLVLWVGEAFRGNGDVVALLAISSAIDMAIYPAAAVLQSIERHPPLAVIALGSTAANIILSIALVGPFGIAGVAAGTLIATTVECLVFVLPYTARVLEVQLRAVAREVGLRLAAPVFVLAGILIVCADRVAITSFARLAVVVAVALGGYAVTYALVAAGDGERAAYRSALRAVLALVRSHPRNATLRRPAPAGVRGPRKQRTP